MKKKDYFQGKKIRVKLNSALLYYTIREVKVSDNNLLCFIDKFGNEKGINKKDIVEVLEEEDEKSV